MFERTENGGFRTAISNNSVMTKSLNEHFEERRNNSVDPDGVVRNMEAVDHGQLIALTAIVSNLEARIIELESKLEQ